ncbi:hypothetical protein ANCDUO_01197 [Ancylostoma duodenale]|uniref:Integrase catalytic domain-containing protein n=1 Tax=Ancylostoma duodenale TaxID=51022 RepID=A0A0C2H3R6_9BILA|nr:hypothetical protein ANCDUO_01197 [Ancylostoma duodenale]
MNYPPTVLTVFNDGPRLEASTCRIRRTTQRNVPPRHLTNCISPPATIAVMRKIFAQFENPHTLVTDKGTLFRSTLFLRTPQFHPQSNIPTSYI